MKNYEDILREKAGRGRSFRVPEAYFDNLAERVMDRLPAEEPQRRPALIVRLWKPMASAACAAAIVCLALTLGGGNQEPSVGASHMESVSAYQSDLSHEDYVERVADYAMMDNYDIYAFLSEE